MKKYQKILESLELRILNKQNGAHLVVMEHVDKCLRKFKGNLNVVLMGIAYGGEVEAVAKLCKERGTVYGFDTFEDLHPGHLADNQNKFEAICMDEWYELYGTQKLAVEYQRSILDKLGNAVLTKGEVHKDSCKDIPKIHLAFLDMDIVASMKSGYSAVKNKLVKGSYLLLHDADNVALPKIHDWVIDELVPQKDTWKYNTFPQELTVLLEKI